MKNGTGQVRDNRHREGCAQGAAARLEAIVFVLEIAPLGVSGGDGCADQHGAEVDIAFASTPTLLLACALVVAGAYAGPGGQMVGAEEHAHIDADFRD